MNAIRGAIRGAWSLVLQQPVYAQALVVAAIALGSAFGLGWTGAQVGAVSAFSAAVLSFLTQRAVTPLEAPVIAAGTAVTVTTPPGQADYVATV